METSATASRTEGQRLLSVAEKLLQDKELSGARDFALLLAQETHPSLDGRCDNKSCKRDFIGRKIKSMPPLVSGKKAYYWSSSFFPAGESIGSSDNASVFQTKSMPPTCDDSNVVDENYRVPPQGSGGPTPNDVEICGRGGGLDLLGKRKRGRSGKDQSGLALVL